MKSSIATSFSPQATGKLMSPLSLSEGFVRGWAYDPLRTTLTIVLSIDGVEQVSGLTGHPVADEFYAHYTPPNATSGFTLALPKSVLDGFEHQLKIKVTEWRGTPLAPEAVLSYHQGHCFGELSYTQQGYIEGWVGFRATLDSTQLPVVTVAQKGQIHYTIDLVKATRALVHGCKVMGQFRIPQSQFALLDQPVFSCLGTELRRHHEVSAFKVVGQIDGVDHKGIHGWALNSANPLETVDLHLVIDGFPLTAIRPNIRRNDIAAGLTLLPEEIGITGFHIDLPAKLKDGLAHTIAVHCLKDGSVLNKQLLTYQHKQTGSTLQQAQALLGKPAMLTEYERPINIVPEVSVIILNRNGALCLDALFDSWHHYNSTAVELIVIDHDSSDASLKVLKDWTNKLPLHIVALDQNDSFSASCNRGAKLAKAPFVLFLNNDIVLLQDILPTLLSTLDNQAIGAVGLKLLKTTFSKEGESRSANMAQVQHLGVRYNLVADQYWPYEVTPDSGLPEEHYSAQEVPIVTGAVMLCRRDEFLALGGFDEAYVYGFEDVEFCLRMGAQQGRRIICRNDLSALHHHGYTRLTGREPSMIDHQLNNQNRLAKQLGLWAKRHYWQSLLTTKNLFANERLTIGFAVHDSLGSQQLAVAVDLAESIIALYPQVKPLFLSAEQGWDQLGEVHVLIALSPYFDLRSVKHARADLRSACYLTDQRQLEAWSINPSLALFDTCLCVDQTLVTKAAELMPEFAKPVLVSKDAPLADLLEATRLRIQIQLPENTPEFISAAQEIRQALKAQGALVYSNTEKPKVAEVIIRLHGNGTHSASALSRHSLRHDVINVLWVLGDADSLQASELALVDQVWLAIPKLPPHLKKAVKNLKYLKPTSELMQGLVDHLQLAVEEKIGHTFHTS
ncbi:MAG: glycosyltransferase [Methylococcaceae bacterium]